MELVTYIDIWWFIVGTILIRFVFNLTSINALYAENECYIISMLEIIKKSLFYVIYDILYIKDRFSRYFILKLRGNIYNKIMLAFMLCFIAGTIFIDAYIIYLALEVFGYKCNTIEFIMLLLFAYNCVVLGFYFLNKTNNRSKI